MRDSGSRRPLEDAARVGGGLGKNGEGDVALFGRGIRVHRLYVVVFHLDGINRKQACLFPMDSLQLRS